ncbi:MAG TPA: hypothetical protein PLO67_10680 [Saprospiraceae bacterium]|nr:hypothetical protein [Saprospiraceae bacterium]
MCKSTKQNRAADSRTAAAGVLPASGGGDPAPAPNAFQGKPERVPQIAYVRERAEDGFLGSAKRYYQFFGINVHEVNSIVEILQHLSQQSAMQKVVVVSHAHPRGMIIPFFTNGVTGTNKEIFTAFAESDLRGLELLSPFPTGVNHLFNWDSILVRLMTAVRARPNATARLTPFSLQTSGRPNGNLLQYFKYCFDIVYLRDPGRVKRNPSQRDGLTSGQRTTLANFVGAILDALKPLVRADWSATDQQILDLKTLITGMTYDDLPGVGDFHPHLGLDDDSMNDFPTLLAIPAAMPTFRTNLDNARQKLDSSSWVDVRGCRVGQDEEYLEALRTFFGRTGQEPKISAPRHFQNYPEIDRERPGTRANIGALITGGHWGHNETAFKEKFSVWADLLRVRPLHVDFWNTLLTGRTARFAGLQWRSEIPALFIPTPGLADLNPMNFTEIIGKLKDFFNVPNASVPSAGVLSGMATLAAALPGHNASLLATVSDSATPAQLNTLFTQLQSVNTALSASVVPAAAPPLNPGVIRGYQTGLNDHLDTGPLAALKTFMTAAATSLETGDGLCYYLLFAGLPVYVFGKPQLSKNGLIVLDAYKGPAFQSWFKCLWADPLPASGAYLTANINTQAHRQVAGLVGDDRTSLVSICPLPRYMNCMRKRPMPSGEDESACGDFTGPF